MFSYHKNTLYSLNLHPLWDVTFLFGLVLPDVSKNPNVFIIRVEQSQRHVFEDWDLQQQHNCHCLSPSDVPDQAGRAVCASCSALLHNMTPQVSIWPVYFIAVNLLFVNVCVCVCVCECAEHVCRHTVTHTHFNTDSVLNMLACQLLHKKVKIE